MIALPQVHDKILSLAEENSKGTKIENCANIVAFTSKRPPNYADKDNSTKKYG